MLASFQSNPPSGRPIPSTFGEPALVDVPSPSETFGAQAVAARGWSSWVFPTDSRTGGNTRVKYKAGPKKGLSFLLDSRGEKAEQRPS
jgi:hypothetical protein